MLKTSTHAFPSNLLTIVNGTVDEPSILLVPPGNTLKVKVLSVEPPALVARTVKLASPTWFGVPDNSPEEFSCKPNRDPLTSEYDVAGGAES